MDEIFNGIGEPLSWLQGLWSVDEVQLVRVFDNLAETEAPALTH